MQSRSWVVVAFLLVVGSMFYRDFVLFGGTEIPAPGGNSSFVTADQRDFFEAKIRPVLVKNCFGCHSAQSKDIGGGLVLVSRAGLRRGGADGVVVVPGNVDGSKLIQAIRYADKDLQMPPDAQLSAVVIRDFETWVKMGAPRPAGRWGGDFCENVRHDGGEKVVGVSATEEAGGGGGFGFRLGKGRAGSIRACSGWRRRI